MTDKPFARKRILLVLTTVLVLTVTGLLVLAAIPKSTIVELTVVVSRISFTLMAPRLPETSVSLLNDGLKIRSMRCEGLDEMEAGLASVPDRQFEMAADTAIDFRSDRPFRPVIKLFDDVRLTLETYRRDRITMRLQSKGAPDNHWQSWIEAPAPVYLRISEPGGSDNSVSTALPAAEWIPVDKRTRIFLTGGAHASDFGLRLAGIGKKNDTVLKVIDIQTGRITSKRKIPLTLQANPTVIPQEDRLIVLEKDDGQDRGVTIFNSNIDIRNPQFFILSGQKEESFVKAGSIRFPARERTTVTLENESYIRVSDNNRFKLKSMALIDGHLKLVLWGRPASLEVGPTTGLMDQYLPSYLLWAYTHRSSALMFSILGWILGSCITFMKLFGFIAK